MHFSCEIKKKKKKIVKKTLPNDMCILSLNKYIPQYLVVVV
jgi:hypothetical protein